MFFFAKAYFEWKTPKLQILNDKKQSFNFSEQHSKSLGHKKLTEFTKYY